MKATGTLFDFEFHHLPRDEAFIALHPLDGGVVNEHGAARPFDPTMGGDPLTNCASPSHLRSPFSFETFSFV
jgi:hypothetical protein